MIFRALHRIGIPSDLFYMASFASMAGSVIAWRVRSERHPSHAERLGIFIGLWAPAFMLMGQGIQQLETARGLASRKLESATREVEQRADAARERGESSLDRTRATTAPGG
jgi:hypothetical protein